MFYLYKNYSLVVPQNILSLLILPVIFWNNKMVLYVGVLLFCNKYCYNFVFLKMPAQITTILLIFIFFFNFFFLLFDVGLFIVLLVFVLLFFIVIYLMYCLRSVLGIFFVCFWVVNLESIFFLFIGDSSKVVNIVVR
jgi:hypothetical protein